MSAPKSNKAASEEVQVVRAPHQALIAKLRMASDIDSEAGMSGVEVSKRVMDRIETARTVDDLFDAQGGDSVEDYVGQTLNVQEVSFARSDDKYSKNEGSLGAYVRISGVLDSGKEFSFSCGGSNVVPFFFKADDLGKISKEEPLRCKINARDTPNGTLYTVARP